MMKVRAVREAELERLRQIERAAGTPFAAVGMETIANDEPPSTSVLRTFVAAERAWGVADHDDRLVAYILVEELDGCAHIEQVSVDPAFARRRLGQRLIARVEMWAWDQGYPALTLTTFTHVPWNGPYYERCGFRYLEPETLTPGLRALRVAEAARGLDQWPRACMRRTCDPAHARPNSDCA